MSTKRNSFSIPGFSASSEKGLSEEEMSPNIPRWSCLTSQFCCLFCEICFPLDSGNCRCRGLGNSCPPLGWVPALPSLCPGAVCSDLTMFGHGGLSQMGTKGHFPRDGLGAQTSCWSSGGLFWGGGWGPGRKVSAEDSQGTRETVSTKFRGTGEVVSPETGAGGEIFVEGGWQWELPPSTGCPSGFWAPEESMLCHSELELLDPWSGGLRGAKGKGGRSMAQSL